MIGINHSNVDYWIVLWNLPNHNPVTKRITNEQSDADRNDVIIAYII